MFMWKCCEIVEYFHTVTMPNLLSHGVTLTLGGIFIQPFFLSNLYSFLFMLEMAASTPASKRMRMSSPTNVVTNQKALDIIHSAQAIPFSWEEAVLERISDWFHTVAKSHNTAPEFLFCGCLTTVRCHSHGPTLISESQGNILWAY